MVKFICNKLGRDKGRESFQKEGITPEYQILTGESLGYALKDKLIEEAHEVGEAESKSQLISELANVLEVLDGLCKAYNINHADLIQVKQAKYQERGGFEQGFFLESISMIDDNPKIDYFRSIPDKYPEEE